jgi:hypothetical protein
MRAISGASPTGLSMAKHFLAHFPSQYCILHMTLALLPPFSVEVGSVTVGSMCFDRALCTVMSRKLLAIRKGTRCINSSNRAAKERMSLLRDCFRLDRMSAGHCTVEEFR